MVEVYFAEIDYSDVREEEREEVKQLMKDIDVLAKLSRDKSLLPFQGGEYDLSERSCRALARVLLKTRKRVSELEDKLEGDSE